MQTAFKGCLGYDTTLADIYWIKLIHGFVSFVTLVVTLAMVIDNESSAYVSSPINTRGLYIADVCSMVLSSDDSTIFRIQTHELSTTRIYAAMAVLAVLMFSTFHDAWALANWGTYATVLKKNAVNTLRHMEYMTTLAAMYSLFASLLMILDVFTHVLLITTTVAAAVVWHASDRLRILDEALDMPEKALDSFSITYEESDVNQLLSTEVQAHVQDIKHLKWSLHYFVCILLLVPFAGVFIPFYLRTAFFIEECPGAFQLETAKIPVFTHFLILTMLAYILSFICIQGNFLKTVCSSRDTPEQVGLRTEYQFILISTVVRMALVWVATFNVLFMWD